MTRKLATLEVSVSYRSRIAGTVSKLRAFRDGRRILKTILWHGLRRDPARVILAYCGIVTIVLLVPAHLLSRFSTLGFVFELLWLVLLFGGFIGLTVAAALVHIKR